MSDRFQYTRFSQHNDKRFIRICCNGNVICAGYYVNSKMHRDGVPCNFVSTDHTHFFNARSSKLNVEFVDAANAEEVAVEDDIIAHYSFKMSHWRDVTTMLS